MRLNRRTPSSADITLNADATHPVSGGMGVSVIVAWYVMLIISTLASFNEPKTIY